MVNAGIFAIFSFVCENWSLYWGRIDLTAWLWDRYAAAGCRKDPFMGPD